MPRKKKPIRTRTRKLPVDNEALAEHIKTQLTKDLDDRNDWNELRIQRYAKLRGWMEPKVHPWENASNAHIPFLMTEVLRTQDTIHNAVLSKHPVVEAMAVQPINMSKQRDIDNLLDYQFFAEQQGEEIVATLAQQYVQDGVFMAFVPWVRYSESVNDLRIFPPLEDEEDVATVIRQHIVQTFNVTNLQQTDKDGFEWEADIQEFGEVQTIKVQGWTRPDEQIELSIFKDSRSYDGPVVIPKSIDEWTVPWRSSNPQPPSPANPNGAEHVMLLDYPSLDEIRRLHYEGYYDLVTEEQLEHLEAEASNEPDQGEPNAELKAVKDEFEGVHGNSETERPEEASGAGKLTRVQAFLGWDINDDGLEEQIVVWMILESKTILRVRYLTEAYPSDPPWRPLATAGFLPVEGRIYAISLLELLESLHDLIKINFDQMTDAATLKNTPWFTYRPQGGLNPEAIHIAAGEGVPMNDPKNDIYVPQFSSAGDSWGMNMISLLTQFSEKASMQGDIQFGRVPKGKASALRTASGMQSILAQGDARPERIMRRYLSGFKDIYRIMHELNQRYLPVGKQYRLIEPSLETGDSVYSSVDNIDKISGRMQFTFTAGMFNTDKETSQQVLQTLMGMMSSELLIKMGIVGAEELHNVTVDFIKLVQREPTRYTKAPKPGPPRMRVTWQEAVSLILSNRMPKDTEPAEGYQAHIQGVSSFIQQQDPDEVSQFSMGLFQVYMSQLQQGMQAEQQQQQMLKAAQQFQQQVGGGPGGGQGGTPGPQAGPPQPTGIGANAQLGPNELADESLPGARGPQ